MSTVYLDKMAKDQSTPPLVEPFRAYISGDLIKQIAKSTSRTTTSTISESEVVVFIGILIHMSVLHMPLDWYWESDPWSSNIIKDSMTKDRFIYIMDNITAEDEVTGAIEKKNPLWRIQPLIESIHYRCCDLDRPKEKQVVCVSEYPCQDLDVRIFALFSPNGLVLDFQMPADKETVLCTLGDLNLMSNRTEIINSVEDAIPLRFVLSVDQKSCMFFNFFTKLTTLIDISERGMDGLSMTKEGTIITTTPSTKNAYLPNKHTNGVQNYLTGFNKHIGLLTYYSYKSWSRNCTIPAMLHLLNMVLVNSWLELKMDTGNVIDDCENYNDYKIKLARQMIFYKNEYQ